MPSNPLLIGTSALGRVLEIVQNTKRHSLAIMTGVRSFDLDLRSAFADGGSLAAAVAIAKVCFALDVAGVHSANDLLAELQQPAAQSAIEWRQDVVLPAAEPLADGRRLIAHENQSNWQAAQRPDGAIEVGLTMRSGWEAWSEIDLQDLLLSVLATEAVVGHGPCVWNMHQQVDLPQTLVLLPWFQVGPSMLLGVVAADGWFGVTVGDPSECELYASPVDRARHDLSNLLGDHVVWDEL